MKFYLVVLAVMSAAAFVCYASDKGRTRRGAWRIPEKALLLLSVLGGALGGTLAMYGLRHKTRHWYFVLVNLLFLAIQIAGVVLFLI